MIIVTGIYAELVVRSGLIVPGDAAAANIAGREIPYRSSLASELVMLCADAAVGVALYVVFRGVSEALALLAALFSLMHAAIVGASLLTAYVPLLLLGDTGYVTVVGEDQRGALALLLMDAHAYG